MIGRALIRTNCVKLLRSRAYCTQQAVQRTDPEWEGAIPFEKIPGPSRYSLIRDFLPGGEFHNLPIEDMHRGMRKKYGDVVKIPGMLGRKDMLLTFDPVIFETVFRTEGSYPVRRGLETFIYYRKKVRPDVFRGTGGLLSEHGQNWLDFRSIANPILLPPKAVRLYVEKVDQVTQEFMQLIRSLRNPQTFETEYKFGYNLKCWSLESIGIIALDERLGTMEGETEESQRILELVNEFFVLVYELDVAPSIWKYYKTERFQRLMNVFDEMTEIIMSYVDKKVKSLEASGEISTNKSEKSILEKLLQINREVAIVMAFDMLMAGVDTTSAALTSCLYHLAKNPDKQEILRNEVFKNLPQQNSKLTNDSLNNLPYMRACLKEALRMNPVLVGNARTTGRDLVLNGYQVPKGIEVAMGTLALHTSDYYFPKSSKFIPERWMKGDDAEQYGITKLPSSSFVFLPFGFGPRSCIGRRFAEMEIFVALSRILREFKVEYNYGPLKYKTSVILSPDDDLKFKFIDLEK